MNKSLLIAGCAVLTASVFGMNSGNHFKSHREKSNNVSTFPYRSPRMTNVFLKKELEKKKQEKKALASRNEYLVQENEALIRECIESFKRLNLQSEEYKAKEENVAPHKTYEFVYNRLYLFEKIGNTNAYRRHATPTIVGAVADNWNDISEIRYANDVSYDKLKNSKIIFYRNKNDSCYIILRINNHKHGIFYGVNANDIEIGENSFSVYDVSLDVGSFTDNIFRQIYVDKSGLYFVPSEENSLESVIDTYQKEGKFDFNGSVLKVSALDGSITLDGQPVTEKNFFDNWVREERETEKQISQSGGRTVIEKLKETKTVLSSAHPEPREILRNFYPPEGNYKGIYSDQYALEFETYSLNSGERSWLGAYGEPDRNWMYSFINKRLLIEKSKSKNGAEELVKNGAFSSILSVQSDQNCNAYGYSNNPIGGYIQGVRDAIAAQVAAKGKSTSGMYNSSIPAPISDMILRYSDLFKDPNFVRNLKPSFAELEKDYEHNKESELWLPFEIVKNL